MADGPGAVDGLPWEDSPNIPERFSAALEACRPRLRRMVALRLDARLRGRIDPSDVIQETYLEASVRLAEYLREPTMPFYLWLRFLAAQRLVTLHRTHLGRRMRDARREVRLNRGWSPQTTSDALASQILCDDTRPSEAAIRAELKLLLHQVLDSMDPLDREVLALRHFEQLSLLETAQVLEMTESGACRRHLRALKHLKEILDAMPGGHVELIP